MSKRALWATSTAPALNRRNSSSTGPTRGRPRTWCWAMPVICVIWAGTMQPGSTSRCIRAASLRPLMRTAPSSTMRETPARVPVVSRSKTT